MRYGICTRQLPSTGWLIDRPSHRMVPGYSSPRWTPPCGCPAGSCRSTARALEAASDPTGEIWCWGANYSRQLGYSADAKAGRLVPNLTNAGPARWIDVKTGTAYGINDTRTADSKASIPGR